MTKIEFVNHASVLISHEDISVLTDPWYEGDVFNKGWNLLVSQNDKQTKELLDRTKYIWVTHEHPDHFAVSFFIKNREQIIKKNIKILFQKTLDSRVTKFLRSKSFDVIELDNNKTFSLSDSFKVRVIKVDFNDSAQIFEIGGKRIINLNDCPFDNKKELNKFAKKSGDADLILSQFSYAAWKGGKDNKKWRENAAKEKLDMLYLQAKALNCNKIIPFASFIYFSNKENMYLNDSHNRPSDVIDYFKETDISIFIMRPFEQQNIFELSQDLDSVLFWDKEFNKVKDKDYFEYDKSFTIEELQIEHNKYVQNILKKNSKFLLYLIVKLKILNVFSDLKIYIYDQKKSINLSLFKGLHVANKLQPDIKLHSNSLMFIFKNEFGFDTLIVNGNFEASKDGFIKVAQHLAIGSLNAMGRSISFSSILKPYIYIDFLRRLLKVKKKLG